MTTINKLADPNAVAAAFAEQFAKWVGEASEKFTVALSGGSTPKILFQLWAEKYADSVDWSKVHFFWGDERCVAPTDDDSNYGVAKKLFLDPVGVIPENIHRVRGEDDADDERLRYENEICEILEFSDEGVPQFDLIILGMGDDGHTASIFPHQMSFFNSEKFCEVATHPGTGQKRITLTGQILNAANEVAFLVTGSNKSEILAQIVNRSGDFESYPAAHVAAQSVTWYVDDAAGSGC